MSVEDNGLYRVPFNPRDLFRAEQTSHGLIDYLDLGYAAESKTRSVSIRGIPALVNKVIMYFASSRGDYLRDERGGEFDFLRNAPMTDSVQFRIMSTVLNTMRRRFSSIIVKNLDVERARRPSGAMGWVVRLTLSYGGAEDLDDSFEVEIPLGISRQEMRERTVIRPA